MANRLTSDLDLPELLKICYSTHSVRKTRLENHA